MKAYQLKIAIKDSHPPIWRRFIVPAGLSFSQLGIVLNEVMGWAGGHLNAFEFYHLEIRVEEEPEDFAFGDYEVEDASETMIEPYLDIEEWFTYIYDFGDDWQHKVTVEKVIADYEYDYPMVLKFKGETPYEDCGGLYGYYNLLEILKNPSHPEYQDMKEWTDHHFTEKYDLDAVNEELKKFHLSAKKSKPMTQNEIYEDVLTKGQPFKQIQGKKEIKLPQANKVKTIFGNPYDDFSGDIYDDYDNVEEFWDKMDDMMEMMSKEMKEMQVNMMSKPPQEMRLLDILSEYTKDNLVTIAKNHSLTGYSKYRKAELAKFVNREILDGDNMRRYLTYLEDEEIEILDKGYKAAGGYIVEWPCNMAYFFQGGYCRAFIDNSCLIPADVWDAYRINCGESWKAERKKLSELLDYMNAAAMLYGFCELDTMLGMYEKNTGISINALDIYRIYPDFPEEKKSFVLRDDRLILYEINDADTIKALKELWTDREFYMPTSEEIKSLSRKGYLPFGLHEKKLESFMINHLDFDEEEAMEVCCNIQQIFRMGGGSKEAMEYLEEYIDLDNKEAKKLKSILKNLWVNTRCIIIGGYTPEELRIKMEKSNTGSEKRVKKAAKKGKIIDFSARKSSED